MRRRRPRPGSLPTARAPRRRKRPPWPRRARCDGRRTRVRHCANASPAARARRVWENRAMHHGMRTAGRRAQAERLRARRSTLRCACSRLVRRRPRRRRWRRSRAAAACADRRPPAHRAQVRRGWRADHAEPGAGGARPARSPTRQSNGRQGQSQVADVNMPTPTTVRPRVVARERPYMPDKGAPWNRASRRAPRTPRRRVGPSARFGAVGTRHHSRWCSSPALPTPSSSPPVPPRPRPPAQRPQPNGQLERLLRLINRAYYRPPGAGRESVDLIGA